MIGSFFSDPGFIVPFALLQVIGLVLAVWLVDFYDRPPLPLVGLMAVWGSTFAVGIAVALREPVLEVVGGGGESFSRRAMVAALVEEPAKGLALVTAYVLSVLLASRVGSRQFEGVTDGAVLGAAVGLGFAFTENLFFLVQQESIAAGLSVFSSRSDFGTGGVALVQHAVYAGAFGAAVGYAGQLRGLVEQLFVSAGGMALAITVHAAHNGLVANGAAVSARALDYAAVVMFVLAIWVGLRHQRGLVEAQLAPEVAGGLLASSDVVAAAARPWSTLGARAAMVRDGRVEELHDLRALRAALVGLAYAKERSVDGADSHRVRELRARVRRIQSSAPEAVGVGLQSPPASGA
jgi:RsiW-degrading membrane proteinase PrsW (M82 family)